MTHWTDTAACRGADTAIFFPESGATKPDVDYVLDTFCRRCPVETVAACLAQADQEEPTHADINGIRGGLTRAQRRARLTARHALENADKPETPGGCGTYKGYKQHRREQEVPCGPCRDAATVYQRDARARRREQVAS